MNRDPLKSAAPSNVPADTVQILRADPDVAVGRLQARILKGAADFRTWHNLAVALYNRKDLTGALSAVETAIARAPESAHTLLLYGMLLREADRFDEALSAFARVERIAADFPRLKASRGVVHFFKGDSARALRDLEQAARSDPRDSTALFNLAVVEVASKRFAAAQATLVRLLEIEPERRGYYAQFLVELGRVQMIEETLTQAHRIKNFMGVVGDRLRRFCDEEAESQHAAAREDLLGIRADHEQIYADLVVFLSAIRPNPMRLERVDVTRLIDRIVFVAQSSADGTRIRRDDAPQLPLVSCDIDSMQEAFLNLLLNGLEAVRVRAAQAGAAEPGEVIIRVQVADVPPSPSSTTVAPVAAGEASGVIRTTTTHARRWVTVDFVDNGVGIAEGDLERIFQFGFTTKPMGSGIGLAHTRRILEDHGGRVEVSSRYGSGTTVRCWLPLEPSISESLVNLAIRSQLLHEPQALILEEIGEDLGI
ncbi:MAG: ATP-binding protein [Planctomycetota bacterium]